MEDSEDNRKVEEGGLPKQTAKNTLKALNALKNELINPFKVLALLQTHIPERLLESHYAEQNPTDWKYWKRNVLYFKGALKGRKGRQRSTKEAR